MRYGHAARQREVLYFGRCVERVEQAEFLRVLIRSLTVIVLFRPSKVPLNGLAAEPTKLVWVRALRSMSLTRTILPPLV